jgi:Tol biopolymer transport system component
MVALRCGLAAPLARCYNRRTMHDKRLLKSLLSTGLRRPLLGIALLALLAAAGCSSPKPKPKKASPPVTLRRLWTSPAVPGMACQLGGSFSPDGSRVTLAMDLGEESNPNWQVWVAGKDAKACLADGRVDSLVDWSPAGKDIAYLADVARKPKLIILDAKGVASRTIKLPAGDYVHPPRWSPDGTTIALSLNSQWDGPAALLLVNARDGRVRQLPATGGLPDISDAPAWSADGREVLLLSYDRPDSGLYDQALWTVDLPTRSADRIHSMGRQNVGNTIAIGFDGASLDACYLTVPLRATEDEPRDSATLFRYDSRSGEAVESGRLSAPPGTEIELPYLCPDGSGMAAVCYDADFGEHGGDIPNVLLWFRDGRSGQESLPSGPEWSVLAWSRDGRRIAIGAWNGKETKVSVYEFSR